MKNIYMSGRLSLHTQYASRQMQNNDQKNTFISEK